MFSFSCDFRRFAPQSGLGRCLLSLLLAAADLALAGEFAAVPVNAIVLSKSNCKFNTPTATNLAFGSIDPSSGANATAAATLVIICRGSAPIASYALSHDSGLYKTGVNLNRMKHATLNTYLPYALTMTPASGSVAKNVDQIITLSGMITPADFQNADIGGYADTVVITLSP